MDAREQTLLHGQAYWRSTPQYTTGIDIYLAIQIRKIRPVTYEAASLCKFVFRVYRR